MENYLKYEKALPRSEWGDGAKGEIWECRQRVQLLYFHGVLLTFLSLEKYL